MLACFRQPLVALGFAVCLTMWPAPDARAEVRLLPPDGPSVTRTEVDQAIRHARRFLHEAMLPSGRWVYRVDLDPQVTVLRKYNILRHAGSMYVLGQAQDRRPMERTTSTLTLGLKYLKAASLRPVEVTSETPMVALWDFQEITNHTAPPLAKLGGAGLGLVAFTSMDRRSPGVVPLDTLRGLGDFILYMQRDNGSFYSKFNPSVGGRDDRWVSLYYPGEAALGLAMLYERDPQERWLAGAARALGYLATDRLGLPAEKVLPDHWAVIATQRVLLQPADAKGRIAGIDRALLQHHAAQVCEALMLHRQVTPAVWEFRGALTPDARLTPTATRLEGLIAGYEVLPQGDDKLRHRVAEAIHEGVAFMLRWQVREGVYLGAVPRSPCAITPAPQSRSGIRAAAYRNADERATEVRIDYVQHFMSALIEYERLRWGGPRD